MNINPSKAQVQHSTVDYLHLYDRLPKTLHKSHLFRQWILDSVQNVYLTTMTPCIPLAGNSRAAEQEIPCLIRY